MYYVYIVQCADDTYYTGMAHDLCQRMREHVTCAPTCAKYTRSHKVVALAMAWQVADRSAALRLEYAVKQRTRAQKLALIETPMAACTLCEGVKATPLAGLTLQDCLDGTKEAAK